MSLIKFQGAALPCYSYLSIDRWFFKVVGESTFTCNIGGREGGKCRQI